MSREFPHSREARGRDDPPGPDAPGPDAPPGGSGAPTQAQFSRPRPASPLPPHDEATGPVARPAAPETCPVSELTPNPTPGHGGRPTAGGGSASALPTDAWNRIGRVVARFEAEWEQGRTPLVDDYLRSAGPLRTPLVVELLHADLEYRLSAGEDVRVADYLDRYPELSAQAAADLVARDYELRRQGGATVSPEDYLGRFPWLETELRRKFSSADTSAPARGSARGSPSGPASTLVSSRKPEFLAGADVCLPHKFEVIEMLGKGGMGVVWRVRRPDLNIDRAVKVIHPNFALNAETRARMLREAQAMAQIPHQHAVIVHDVGTDPVPYIEMEYVRGQTLDRVLRPNAPMSLEWTARILEQLCEVLQIAHDHGIVHRDLKPSNLMLADVAADEKEFLKVLDFGIAKFLHTSDLTPNDLTLGTVMYMSPEQVKDSSRVDPSSDIYTIGVILYEFLTGCRPFTSRIPQILYDISYTPAPRFQERNPAVNVPRPVEDLVLRCLDKDPQRRPASARALAEEFRRLALPAEPGPRADGFRLTRRQLLYAAVPALGAGSLGLYWALRPRDLVVKPAQRSLTLTSGSDGEVSILVGPAGQVPRGLEVRPDALPSEKIRVVPDQEKSAPPEFWLFRVVTHLDADPVRHRTLRFLVNNGGRSVQTTSVELNINPTPVAPLPPGWTPARGSPLARVDGKVYPTQIERVVADDTAVAAVLVTRDNPSDPAPFYIMRHKVWTGLFKVFADQNPALVQGDDRWRKAADLLPVMYVTGPEAQAFAEWLGGKGRGFLPTLAQWDQAAGFNRKGYDVPAAPPPSDRSGEAPPAFAVDLKAPLPVGKATLDISPFGCRDMYANGLEWTRLPHSRDDLLVRVRSASFKPEAGAPLRKENVGNNTEDFTEPHSDVGFRVVIELDPDG